jgi:hypothetical protein
MRAYAREAIRVPKDSDPDNMNLYKILIFCKFSIKIVSKWYKNKQ